MAATTTPTMEGTPPPQDDSSALAGSTMSSLAAKDRNITDSPLLDGGDPSEKEDSSQAANSKRKIRKPTNGSPETRKPHRKRSHATNGDFPKPNKSSPKPNRGLPEGSPLGFVEDQTPTERSPNTVQRNLGALTAKTRREQSPLVHAEESLVKQMQGVSLKDSPTGKHKKRIPVKVNRRDSREDSPLNTELIPGGGDSPSPNHKEGIPETEALPMVTKSPNRRRRASGNTHPHLDPDCTLGGLAPGGEDIFEPGVLREPAPRQFSPGATARRYASPGTLRRHFSTPELTRAPDPPELTLQGLLDMTPMVHGQDVVRNAARDLFLSCVKNAPNVHDVFFPDSVPHALASHVDLACFDFETFACVYVCEAISDLEEDSFGIHEMINSHKVMQYLSEIYKGPLWKKIGMNMYSTFFPDIVRDPRSGVGFRSYMNKSVRSHWTDALITQMRDSQWMYSVMKRGWEGRDGYNTHEVNLLFYKLHLLDPSQVFFVYDSLRKAFPDLNLELVTTNYLGGPLDPRLVQQEVTSALRHMTSAGNASRWSTQPYDVYYGMKVVEFVFGETRKLDLWTGRYPDNKRVCTLRDRLPLNNRRCDIL